MACFLWQGRGQVEKAIKIDKQFTVQTLNSADVSAFFMAARFY
jgi:hypothetical protein